MQPASSRVRTPTGSLSSRTGTPAPYGHACTNCAKAKCKCIHRQAGGACERCFRLSKDCQTSVTSRKRNPRKTPGSRTAHLEEKLDDLVSLIRSQAGHRASGLNTAATGLENTELAAGPATVPSTSSVSSPNASSTAQYLGGSSHTGASTPEGARPSSDYDYPIADDVAERNLTVFRRDMVQYCSVVYLPPGTTALELRQTRPFLWLSIMACTERSLRQAHAIGDKLRQVVANKVVLAQERSMDFLQGLLVFLQWPHCHRREKPFLALWTNLVVAMAQDLGFMASKGESAFTYVRKFWMPKQATTEPGADCHRTSNPERSMEDRRALLALYIWTTMFSQMTRRDNVVGWTPFMEECLRTLMDSPEWEGDVILATQVRCVLITQQVTEMSLQQSVLGEGRTPMYFYHALNSQLQDIWRTLPQSASQHEAVLLHLHSTEVTVHELALTFEPSSSNMDVLKRLEALQRCLKALEEWFQVWSQIASSRYIGLTFATFIQLIHAIVALFRLSTVDDIPAWNPAEVRHRLELFSLLDRLANQQDLTTSALSVVEDDPGQDSIWSNLARILRIIKRGIQQDYPSLNTVDGMQIPEVAGESIQEQSQKVQDPFMASFGDDPWLSAIFVPWDSMNF